MPLPRHPREVSRPFQQFGESSDPVEEPALNALRLRIVDLFQGAQTGLVRISAGKERGAGGAAFRGIVKIREFEAAGCQGIDVGCGNFAAEAPPIGITLVIGQDDDDIWLS